MNTSVLPYLVSTKKTDIDVDSMALVNMITYSIVLVLSFTGNAFLMLTLIRIRRLKKLVDKLVFNLAACNVLLVCASIPTDLISQQYVDYPFGHIGCKIIHPISTYAINTGVLTLVVIAFERWKCVAKPLNEPVERTNCILMVLHLLGVISVVPYSIALNYKDGDCGESWSPLAGKIYTVVLFTVQYAVPVPIMLVLYTQAWIIVQRTNITCMIRSSKESSDLNEPMCNNSNFSMTSQPSLLEIREEDEESSSHDTKLLNPLPNNKIKAISPPSRSSLLLSPNVEHKNLCGESLCKTMSLDTSKSTNLASTMRGNHSQVNRSISLTSNCSGSNRSRHTGRLSHTSTTTSRSKSLLMDYIFPDSSVTEENTLQHVALKKRFQQSRELLKTFTCVVLVFVVFMLPNQIYWLILSFADNGAWGAAWEFVLLIMTYANCVLNPWIYGGLNTKFRHSFKKLLQLVCENDTTTNSQLLKRKKPVEKIFNV